MKLLVDDGMRLRERGSHSVHWAPGGQSVGPEKERPPRTRKLNIFHHTSSSSMTCILTFHVGKLNLFHCPSAVCQHGISDRATYMPICEM